MVTVTVTATPKAPLLLPLLQRQSVRFVFLAPLLPGPQISIGVTLKLR